jgi:hypothetical protein
LAQAWIKLDVVELYRAWWKRITETVEAAMSEPESEIIVHDPAGDDTVEQQPATAATATDTPTTDTPRSDTTGGDTTTTDAPLVTGVSGPLVEPVEGPTIEERVGSLEERVTALEARIPPAEA